MDRKIVSDGTKTLIAHIGIIEVSRPELITGLFFVGTHNGEETDSTYIVQFGLGGWEIRDQSGGVMAVMPRRILAPGPASSLTAAVWLRTKLEKRHRARLAAAGNTFAAMSTQQKKLEEAAS